jgi:transcription elongation factor Elf1
MEQEEYFFDCPHCGAQISMMMDLSIMSQDYVEDCETCCRPVKISFVVEDGAVSEFNAEAMQ